MLLLLLLLTPKRSAADVAGATRLLRHARARLAAADFQGALSALRRARQVADPSTPGGARITARVQLQRGEILTVLGRTRQAVGAFIEALKHDPSVSPDPQRNKASTIELFERLKARLWGEIEITSDVPEAQIWVDGGSVGQAPYRARLAIGTHEVRATILGRDVVSRSVVVPAKRSVRLALDVEARCATLVVNSRPSGARVLLEDGTELGATPLERLVAPGDYTLELRRGGQSKRVSISASAGAPARVSASLAGASDDGPDPDPRQPSESFWGRSRTWTWVALGGAAVSAAVALGFGAAADSNFDEYNAPSTTRDRGMELEQSVRSKATTANILYGVAGALLVGSVVLLFVEGRPASGRRGESPATRFGVAPALGSLNGLALHGRF